MISRIFLIFKQDIIIASRNYFWIFNFAVLLISTLIVNVIPVEVDNTDNAFAFFYDRSRTGFTENFISFLNAEDKLLNSEEELIKNVTKKRENSGFIIEEKKPGILSVTYVHNGQMDNKTIKIIDAALENTYRQYLGEPPLPAAVKTINLGPAMQPVSVRQNLVINLMAMEVVLLGFLFIAVMMFQEKQEGYIFAYRITPSGVISYIIGKSLVWIFFTLLYGVLFIMLNLWLVAGIIQWLKILLMLTIAGLFYSLLSLGIAVYFKGLSDWTFIGLAVLIINIIPGISYLNPAFSPPCIEWIPSYFILFAARDILFYPGQNANFINFLKQMLIFLGICIPFVYLSVNFRLMREKR